MKSSTEELEKITSKKSDDDLIDMLYIHRQDYTDDAINAAEEEFQRRKLTTPTLSHVASIQERELAPLNWPLRLLSFFISTAFFGIPVLLAWRHFSEKSEKNKAREWARWAMYGFAFYVVLFVIRLR